MSKFEQLLEGGEVTVKTVGKPKNGGVINKMIVGLTAAFAVGGAGLYIHNHSVQPEASCCSNSPRADNQYQGSRCPSCAQGQDHTCRSQGRD